MEVGCHKLLNMLISWDVIGHRGYWDFFGDRMDCNERYEVGGGQGLFMATMEFQPP